MRTLPATLIILLTTAAACGQQPVDSTAARVADIVSRLTTHEKILQMQHHAPAIGRLGIPAYNWWNEALHGVARNGVATVFPQAIGLAAMWDAGLLHSIAEVISTEARAKHHEDARNGRRGMYQGLTFWSPNINIFRDPRWGRGQETYGEDPFLTGRLASAFVRGMQGDDPRYRKTIATPKHFAVHSGPEPTRHSFDARPSDIDLYETYLPAFEACIREAGAGSIMGAYNRLHGTPCCASNDLLGGILRGRWGFDGYVVSDCGAVWDMYTGHLVVATAEQASALAVKAGCDLTCGGEYESLEHALELGLLSIADIDRSVTRLFTARMQLGMFDPPERVPYTSIPFSENDSPAHDSLARRAAQQSIVLLQNRNHVLPLSRSLKRIAVIGPYADNIDVLLGNYNGTPSHPVTILQGMRDALGADRVLHVQGVPPPEATAEMHLVPASALRTPDGRPGLRVEYHAGLSCTGAPVVTRIDSSATQFFGDGAPAEGLPADSFAVCWTGSITAPESGRWMLALITEERGRLWLDNTLAIDNWEPYQRNHLLTCELTMQAGQPCPLRIEYADEQETAWLTMKWMRMQDSARILAGIDEAVRTAAACDAVVLVAGISPKLEGEELQIRVDGFGGGDRSDLTLPRSERLLIDAVARIGKPTALVLTGGSALAVGHECTRVPSVLMAWYPGQQGGAAVADVLLGDVNPAGRLPVTFYNSVDDLPPFDDYSMRGRTYRYFNGTPLFPFGHGLSYTHFTHERLTLPQHALSSKDTVECVVTIRNDGPRDGDEVVQIYASRTTSIRPRPHRWLVGFARVHLRAGERRDVPIAVPVQCLRSWDATTGDYVVEPGDYVFNAGSSSATLPLHGTVPVQ